MTRGQSNETADKDLDCYDGRFIVICCVTGNNYRMVGSVAVNYCRLVKSFITTLINPSLIYVIPMNFDVICNKHALNPCNGFELGRILSGQQQEVEITTYIHTRSKCQHIILILNSLHCLSNEQGIQFKICPIVPNALYLNQLH